MILDFHAWRGPFIRQGRRWGLDDLVPWADRAGLDVMIVESREACLYSRLGGEHDRLIAECRASDGRFLPAASLNLTSDVHSVRLAREAREQGFACVVMRCDLYEESRVLHDVLKALAGAPLPVYRPMPHGEMDVLFRVARQYADVPFVIAPDDFTGVELNHRLIDLPNVYLAIARTVYTLGQIETAVRHMGAERILFATDMPAQHPGRPLGVVADAELPERDKQMILGGSARKLLKAHGVEVTRAPRTVSLPRPPCPVVDAHGHIGSDCRRPDFDDSTECLLRYLQRAGGECIYLSSTDAIFGDMQPGNQRTLACMQQYPERIRGYFVINPWQGEACLDEIRACRRQGFVGLKPYPYTFGHELADPIMDPVYELAEAMGLCVLAHSTATDLQAVLEKRPNLRLIAAHMTSEHAQKAHLAREFPNCILEASGAGTGIEDVQEAVRIAGPDKIMYGSDLNCNLPGWTLFPLMMSGLPEATLRAILRDNALRYFA